MDSEDRSTQKDTSSSAGASSLSDLIARLEKATGPDRETDLAIHLAVYSDSEIARLMSHRRGFDNRDGMAWEIGAGSVLYQNNSNGQCWSNGGYPLPAFTSSIDAAMSLVPDGMEKDFTDLYGTARVAVGINANPGPFYGEHKGGSLAIALCIAALRARSQIESLPANDSAETRLEI